MFSAITVDDLILYLRLNAGELTLGERAELSRILDSARQWILSYTGLTPSECDNYADFDVAIYVLSQDMYDTRSFYVDKNNVNQVVKNILDMHSKNYI
jgi:hypothetical protein